MILRKEEIARRKETARRQEIARRQEMARRKVKREETVSFFCLFLVESRLKMFLEL